MENELLKTIRTLQKKEQELKRLQKGIASQRKENKNYLLKEEQRREEELSPLLQETKEKENELSTLFSTKKVSIALSDLVEELSKLSGISILNMEISVGFENTIYCDYKGNLLSEENFDNNVILINMLGDNTLGYYDSTQPFRYQITYPFDLKELQADGKTLLEHCSSCHNGLNSYLLHVDKRIGDIICHIDMEKIIRGDELNWNPPSLFIKAIMNCVKQGKYVASPQEFKEKQKVLN